jgi:hypothetical protein
MLILKNITIKRSASNETFIIIKIMNEKFIILWLIFIQNNYILLENKNKYEFCF